MFHHEQRRWLFTVLALSACAGAQHSPPDRISTTQHERIATTDDRLAATQRSEFDPTARTSLWICSGGLARADVDVVEPCWREDVNPTVPHLRAAQRLHALAIEQRRESAELLQAEARVCTGVSLHNQETSPFEHAADIADVDEIEPTDVGHVAGTNVRGIRVVFHPVVGLTVQSLQRIVDCHVARNAALGHQDPEVHDDLLVPQRLQVHVDETVRGLAVDVTSDDPSVVRQLRASAERLRARLPDAISAPLAPSPAP